jgi:hypothetical protein
VVIEEKPAEQNHAQKSRCNESFFHDDN